MKKKIIVLNVFLVFMIVLSIILISSKKENSGFINYKKIELFDKIFPNKPFSIIFTGVDNEHDGNLKGYADTNVLMTFNPQTNKLLLSTIPRDSAVFQPCINKVDKLSHTTVNGGLECLEKTFSSYFDIEVSGHVVTNFQGFIDLVDFIGGIDVEVKSQYPLGFKTEDKRLGEYINIPVGITHADGRMALAYARTRKELKGSATERGENNLDVFNAIIYKLFSLSIEDILKFKEMNLKNFSTSLSSKDLSVLSKLAFENRKIEIIKKSVSTYGNNDSGLWLEYPNLGSDTEIKKIIWEIMQKN